MEEIKKKSKQHTQVPNDMTKHLNLEMRDMHVYATIKRHMNKNTKECFPSLACLAKESGYSIPTIQKSITILKDLEYIQVRRDGRKNVYSFNSYKTFEAFSTDFLDNENITTGEKALIISTQQFMYKDQEGVGKISYSDKELAQILNTSEKTISRLNKGLVEKGFLTIVKTNAKDSDTGIMFSEKFFRLNELGQEIIWTLQRHEDDINELKENTEANSKDLKIVLKELDALRKREAQRDELLIQNGIDISKLNNISNNEILL